MWSEDKSSSTRVRVGVIGHAEVGKSAMTVRYLTGRFIGEYRSNSDLLYHKTLSLEAGTTELEILDVYTGNEEDFPMEQVIWADGCIVVYNITDRMSFEYAAKCLAEFKALPNPPSAYLVANKADLDHLREIPEKEGAALAAAHSIGFCEVSVADYSPNLNKAFEKVILDLKARNHKQNRKFSVSKMFGNLMGSNGSSSSSSSSSKSLANVQTTVTPCHKGELQKTREIKRRQGFLATTSI